MVARLNNYKNLPKALDESFEIPFDVSFSVISSDGGNTETVGAHKIMLALRSEVLRKLDFIDHTHRTPLSNSIYLNSNRK